MRESAFTEEQVAHALGLRAAGSTSLDDEEVEFFSAHAAGKRDMFVTVFGRRRVVAS